MALPAASSKNNHKRFASTMGTIRMALASKLLVFSPHAAQPKRSPMRTGIAFSVIFLLACGVSLGLAKPSSREVYEAIV